VEDDLAEGLELMRRGEHFEAHEALELAWRAADDPERDFLQGLVHLTVAWYQAGRGRPIACGSQLAKARRRLTPYAPSHRGVDVSALLTQVDAALTLVDRGSLELAPLVV
jgi:predicted metal-dependent hydrolase